MSEKIKFNVCLKTSFSINGEEKTGLLVPEKYPVSNGYVPFRWISNDGLTVINSTNGIATTDTGTIEMKYSSNTNKYYYEFTEFLGFWIFGRRINFCI